MANLQYIAAALAVALCALLVNGDTTGQTIYGYTYVSDVTAYHNFTLDVADVQTATNSSATNFAAVKEIYNVGKNALRSGTPRPTKGVAERAYTGEAFHDLAAAFHKDPIWLGTFLGSAVNGSVSPFIETAADYCCGVRVEVVRAGYRAFLAAYLLHEVDAAYNARGPAAARIVDEAVALWYGNNATVSLSTLANTRARRYCTNTNATTGSRANDDFFAAANAMVAAFKADDTAAAGAARTSMWKAVAAMFLQNVLYNGAEAASPPDAYLAITTPCITKCGIAKAKQAAALMYWRAVAPILAVAAPQEAAAVTPVLLYTGPALNATSWEGAIRNMQAAADKAGISWAEKVSACAAAPTASLGSVTGRKLKMLLA